MMGDPTSQIYIFVRLSRSCLPLNQVEVLQYIPRKTTQVHVRLIFLIREAEALKSQMHADPQPRCGCSSYYNCRPYSSPGSFFFTIIIIVYSVVQNGETQLSLILDRRR